MDWDWIDDDEETTITAYHEAGHAVVGCALGAVIESVGLSQASIFDDGDDGLPLRFGDCLINWGKVDPDSTWQQQRELLTILAGPVAEATYREESIDEIDMRSWEMDFRQASRCAAALCHRPPQQQKLIAETIRRLRDVMNHEEFWSAIAAVADELLLGDEMQQARVVEITGFWLRRL